MASPNNVLIMSQSLDSHAVQYTNLWAPEGIRECSGPKYGLGSSTILYLCLESRFTTLQNLEGPSFSQDSSARDQYERDESVSGGWMETSLSSKQSSSGCYTFLQPLNVVINSALFPLLLTITVDRAEALPLKHSQESRLAMAKFLLEIAVTDNSNLGKSGLVLHRGVDAAGYYRCSFLGIIPAIGVSASYTLEILNTATVYPRPNCQMLQI
ncbi:hypothetical protein TWF481_010388 [Arthrobotrys musiformis]|uniref:Uncharacterized protein n=1 Tax=Arthrobotrys musiformis TaxID=47236 RepID=A0AAV9W213_9PEZI